MIHRYETPSPPPPQRSKSSMCAPHSTHRKLTPAVNRSLSLFGKSANKKLFLSERPYKQQLPDSFPIKQQKAEELIQIGRDEINKHSYEPAISTFTTVVSIDNSNLEGFYYRGMCLYKLGKFREAIPDLIKVITTDPIFNKYAYYLTAICFEKLNDVVAAVRYISKSIYHFPKFARGYVLRGNLYNQQQRYDKALSDFRKALKINVEEGSALIGMAESLLKIGDSSTAFKVLTQAITFPSVFVSAMIKRAQLLLSQNKLSLAITDFDALLEQCPGLAEGYYYKAKALMDNQEYSDAVLSFEQAIKYDKSNEFTRRAVFYLGYIKVKEKDFYGAIHQFDRTTSNVLPEQKLLRTFAEGVIFLVKRKYKEGITNFSKILKKKTGAEEYLASCYEYLGFAYCSLKLYTKALKNFKQAASIEEITKASKYNFELATGYMHAERNEFAQAANFFKKASMIFPMKPEPWLLLCSLILEEQKEFPVPKEKLEECERLVDKAAEIRKDSEVAYYQGIILYMLGNFEKAAENAKICIEKADENIPEHYVFRALCYAAFGNYSEAVNDFSVALQLNENLEYVYDYRGRCAYLMDDSDLAYMDFQKLVNMNENSPKPYIQTAIVLMHSSSFSGAIASLENANSIAYTIEASLLKAKAYILQYDVELALHEFDAILDNELNIATVWRDRELLAFISSFSNENPKDFHTAIKKLDKFHDGVGDIFDMKMVLWYKGVFLLYLERYEEAIKIFQKVIEILQKREKKLSSDDALILEEQNCEILYNISLCYLSINKQKTFELFMDLSKILNKKHKGQLLFLSALVQQELNNSSMAEKLLEEAYKCDPDTLTPYLNKQIVVIKPLNTTNSLAINFPLLQPFEYKKVKLRPALCLPKPNLPNIEFGVESRVIEFFSISKVNPKPEPPWLKRTKGCIMFTDNIVDLEQEPMSKAISKVELAPKAKQTAKSGVLMRRNESEDKGSFYLQSNEDEGSDKDTNSEEVPEIVLRKIKEMCY